MVCFEKSKNEYISQKKEVFRLPSMSLMDKGKVQLGGQGPAFRKSSIADTGKVRVGGQGPIFQK